MYNKIKYLCVVILTLLTISFSAYGVDLESQYVWSDFSSSVTTDSPVDNSDNTDNFLNITSGSAVLIEQSSR